MSYYYYHHLPTIYATNTTNTGRPLSSPDQISRLSHTARAISVNPIALVCPRKKLLKEEWWVKRSGEERDYPVHMLSNLAWSGKYPEVSGSKKVDRISRRMESYRQKRNARNLPHSRPLEEEEDTHRKYVSTYWHSAAFQLPVILCLSLDKNTFPLTIFKFPDSSWWVATLCTLKVITTEAYLYTLCIH